VHQEYNANGISLESEQERRRRSVITPYLLYDDVAGAIGFLAKAFGFKKSGSAMSDKNGKLTHAAMKLGDDLIMMGCPGPKYKNPKQLGEATQILYVNVSDADKHFARAKKAGAKILEEPDDTFYGHRRYGAEDPEGHQWYFFHEIKARQPNKRR
jgi:PhnB protein